MTPEKIARINELYRMKKAGTLTDELAKEQQQLRKEYIASVRQNLKGQLDNIDIEQEDGTITPLQKKK